MGVVYLSLSLYSRELFNNNLEKEKALSDSKLHKAFFFRNRFHSFRRLDKVQIDRDLKGFLKMRIETFQPIHLTFGLLLEIKRFCVGLMRRTNDSNSVFIDSHAIVNKFATFLQYFH